MFSDDWMCADPLAVTTSADDSEVIEALLQQCEVAPSVAPSVRDDAIGAPSRRGDPVKVQKALAEPCIELGFASPHCDEGFAQPERFPSKVGGLPVWLHPIPPHSSTRQCGSCGKPLRFLLQLYCPRPELPQAFHRSLLLFCCGSVAVALLRLLV